MNGNEKTYIYKEEIVNESDVVTVGVLAYNSSKTILETLESIKMQTYPNISLHICDDCSWDDTVEKCNNWIEENKSRFVSTKVFVSSPNLGVSWNSNRNIDMCETRYLKEIAGDDLLTPDCLEIYMNYVKEHPDAVITMGRLELFGEDIDKQKNVESWFDYDFFNMTQKEQLHHLTYKANCLPAPSAFYNVDEMRSMGLRNDERIPMMEDWAKWINFLKKGGKFHFVDAVTAKYRVGSGLTTKKKMPKIYMRSLYKFNVLYRYSEYIKQNDEHAIDKLVNEQIGFTAYDENAEFDHEMLIRWYYKNKKHLRLLRVLGILFGLETILLVFLLKMMFG